MRFLPENWRSLKIRFSFSLYSKEKLVSLMFIKGDSYCELKTGRVACTTKLPLKLLFPGRSEITMAKLHLIFSKFWSFFPVQLVLLMKSRKDFYKVLKTCVLLPAICWELICTFAKSSCEKAGWAKNKAQSI